MMFTIKCVSTQGIRQSQLIIFLLYGQSGELFRVDHSASHFKIILIIELKKLVLCLVCQLKIIVQ